jgi:hypothetical protein
MRTGKSILVILCGGVAGAILSLLALKLSMTLGPDRNLLIFDLSALVAILTAAFGLFLGCIAAAAGIFLKPTGVAVTVSIAIAIAVSWNAIRDSMELYRNPIYFDSELFVSDLAWACSNVVIFPLICCLAWYAGTRFPSHRTPR